MVRPKKLLDERQRNGGGLVDAHELRQLEDAATGARHVRRVEVLNGLPALEHRARRLRAAAATAITSTRLCGAAVNSHPDDRAIELRIRRLNELIIQMLLNGGESACYDREIWLS